MGISMRSNGDWSKTMKYLTKVSNLSYEQILNKYGELGVQMLAEATPKRTGLTAASWSFKIESTGSGQAIVFTNSNENKGVSIALILEMGHGTRNGGYVRGRKYISPAVAKAFDQMVLDLWKEVTTA